MLAHVKLVKNELASRMLLRDWLASQFELGPPRAFLTQWHFRFRWWSRHCGTVDKQVWRNVHVSQFRIAQVSIGSAETRVRQWRLRPRINASMRYAETFRGARKVVFVVREIDESRTDRASRVPKIDDRYFCSRIF